MAPILEFFHHIHHENGEHVVHHCGGAHAGLDYTISHCSCGKHRIDKPKAIGHDFENKERLVVFSGKCPAGGWHVESGRVVED
jgi:hypothetical protein